MVWINVHNSIKTLNIHDIFWIWYTDHKVLQRNKKTIYNKLQTLDTNSSKPVTTLSTSLSSGYLTVHDSAG